MYCESILNTTNATKFLFCGVRFYKGYRYDQEKGCTLLCPPPPLCQPLRPPPGPLPLGLGSRFAGHPCQRLDHYADLGVCILALIINFQKGVIYMKFSYNDVCALLNIAANIGLLSIVIPCLFNSENGWTVPLFAVLCWIGGYNFHDDVIPFIRKQCARLHKKPTT